MNNTTTASSRYGIMENINSKKIDAQNRLAAIERDIKVQSLNFDKQQNNTQSQIENEKSNYERNFQNWKNDRLFEIETKETEFNVEMKTRQQEHDRLIKKLNTDIIKKESSYVDEHERVLKNYEQSLVNSKENFSNWLNIKEMEIEALKDEITGYESTINDLKEVSKESVKKE